MNLIPRNPLKLQSSKSIFAPARQNCKPPSSSDCGELQESTLQRTLMKLSVQPERETDKEYENEAYDDFRLFPQQSFQPTHHGLEKNPHDENKCASINDYQSELKPSRRHKSL